ncbi:hypothetical protein [Novosphingobium aerophilum]|uniref:Rap1a immunity protein domain-containing protein n=1 Tax=Novosphingobium aerophilum TaxID=2839843 RepID=A0A7X1F6X5_9SPHN|nr:hypothetical protein [Novosphingobium aerophilum]MBC2651520.1 hypothetical protein [Novosphingobium aerophilum]
MQRKIGRIAIAAVVSLTLVGAVPASAAEGQITVGSFLARANALKAKGIAALFSSELKTLRGIGQAAGAEYRARLAQERAAGRPSSCPPPKVEIGNDQFLAHLETYPAAARDRTTLTTAIGDLFARKWPCR